MYVVIVPHKFIQLARTADVFTGIQASHVPVLVHKQMSMYNLQRLDSTIFEASMNIYRTTYNTSFVTDMIAHALKLPTILPAMYLF